MSNALLIGISETETIEISEAQFEEGVTYDVLVCLDGTVHLCAHRPGDGVNIYHPVAYVFQVTKADGSLVIHGDVEYRLGMSFDPTPSEPFVHGEHVEVLIDLARSGEELTFKELAAALGVNPESIDVLWQGTLRRLGVVSKPKSETDPDGVKPRLGNTD